MACKTELIGAASLGEGLHMGKMFKLLNGLDVTVARKDQQFILFLLDFELVNSLLSFTAFSEHLVNTFI